MSDRKVRRSSICAQAASISLDCSNSFVLIDSFFDKYFSREAKWVIPVFPLSLISSSCFSKSQCVVCRLFQYFADGEEMRVAVINHAAVGWDAYLAVGERRTVRRSFCPMKFRVPGVPVSLRWRLYCRLLCEFWFFLCQQLSGWSRWP